MKDAMLDKLKRVNISSHPEQTKERVREIWDNADKKSKRELLAFTGHGIYSTITKITKNGRITAKIAITLSRYFDVNPFYMLGETDEQENYSDEVLKDFLIKFGYRKLWNEYSKHLQADDGSSDAIKTIQAIQQEEHDKAAEKTTDTAELTDLTDGKKHDDIYIKDTSKETVDEPHKDQANKIPQNAVLDTPADISQETITMANNLTEDEVITLMRSLLIRSKAQSADLKQFADHIKLLLLLN